MQRKLRTWSSSGVKWGLSFCLLHSETSCDISVNGNRGWLIVHRDQDEQPCFRLLLSGKLLPFGGNWGWESRWEGRRGAPAASLVLVMLGLCGFGLTQFMKRDAGDTAPGSAF